MASSLKLSVDGCTLAGSGRYLIDSIRLLLEQRNHRVTDERIVGLLDFLDRLGKPRLYMVLKGGLMVLTLK